MAYSVISDSGFSFTPEAFGFAQQELSPTILYQLYAHTREIAEEVNDRIRARTAYWTGALRDDETYELSGAYLSNAPLVNFYLGEENQIEAWGRTYGRFIEGPELGYSSPTIKNPSHMYAKAEAEDMGVIDDWAIHYLEVGADKLAKLQGEMGSWTP
jgi:hypothetical protein